MYRIRRGGVYYIVRILKYNVYYSRLTRIMRTLVRIIPSYLGAVMFDIIDKLCSSILNLSDTRGIV